MMRSRMQKIMPTLCRKRMILCMRPHPRVNCPSLRTMSATKNKSKRKIKTNYEIKKRKPKNKKQMIPVNNSHYRMTFRLMTNSIVHGSAKMLADKRPILNRSSNLHRYQLHRLHSLKIYQLVVHTTNRTTHHVHPNLMIKTHN